jgi:hypothetical protein
VIAADNEVFFVRHKSGAYNTDMAEELPRAF